MSTTCLLVIELIPGRLCSARSTVPVERFNAWAMSRTRGARLRSAGSKDGFGFTGFPLSSVGSVAEVCEHGQDFSLDTNFVLWYQLPYRVRTRSCRGFLHWSAPRGIPPSRLVGRPVERSSRVRLVTVALTIAVLTALAPCLTAQSANATISGIVQDPSG